MEEEKYLTLSELAKEIGRSESTLKKWFERTKRNLERKGVHIERYGTGFSAKYTVEYYKEKVSN